MNRKIMTTLIVSLFLVSLVTAVTLSNKSTALSYITNKLSERTSAIDRASNSIVYTEDMRCVYTSIDATEPVCFAYFNYTVNGTQIESRAVVAENATLKDIDYEVQLVVRNKIQETYKEAVEYTGTSLKDRVISLSTFKEKEVPTEPVDIGA